MAETMSIRVIYPLQSGRIVLRMDDDGNRNVEAVAVDASRTAFEFHFVTPRPYLYFKSCVIDHNGFHWSKGNNYLAIVNRQEGKSIYPQDRMYEYTQPGYEGYGRFITEELKKEVDAHLRTLAAPEHTAVMGSSLGGVVSLYLAWQHPQVFGKAACLSSTFGYRDDLRQRIGSEAKRNAISKFISTAAGRKTTTK